MFKKEKNGKTNKKLQKEAILLVFLFIIFAIIVIMILLAFSKWQIQIINFRFSSCKPRHMNKDYEFIIRCYILGIIPILKICITKEKLEKMRLEEKIKKIDFKILKEDSNFDKALWQSLKKLDMKINSLNLHIDIGTENASLTAIIVVALSTIIAILLRNKIKNLEHQHFMVNPIYQNQNLVNAYISGIFELKMSHIIIIIYSLAKNKKKGVKKYERTSHRRTYGYSYE